MKKTILLSGLIAAVLSTNAQTVSTFDQFELSTNSYYNGESATSGSAFTSGNAEFANVYNGYWESGWAYSNVLDTTTAGYTNLYGARTGTGFESSNYAVGQNNSKVILKGAAAGKIVEGFYVTNSTYAALSMQDGDFFGKKFGGVNGTDSDWFMLTVKNYYNGVLQEDSVDFYLANYTAKDSQNDYIVKDWRWVDLSVLGKTDSLVFSLSSSDNGDYGMNTPGFFCIDNFTTLDSPLNINVLTLVQINVFPNPVVEVLNVATPSNNNAKTIQIIDLSGSVLITQQSSEELNAISVKNLANGIYFLKLTFGTEIITKTFVKN